MSASTPGQLITQISDFPLFQFKNIPIINHIIISYIDT